MTARSRRWRGVAVRRRLVAPVAVLAVGGAAWAGYGAVSADTPSYRLATATRGDVEQRLALTGTIAATGRADLSAAASGTVVEVAVATGERVREGQVLVRLDRTALDAAVTDARADLAAARAQLEQDQEAQVAAVTAAATAASGPTGSTGSTGSRGGTDAAGGTGGPGGSSVPAAPDDGDAGTAQSGGDGGSGAAALQELLATLAAQQTAVTDAASTVTGALTTADEALMAQEAACAVDPGDADDSGDPDGAGDGGGAGDAGDGGGAGDAGDAGDADDADDPAGLSTECTQALHAVQSAQARVAIAQEALQAALTDLGQTLTTGVGTLGEAVDAQDAAGAPADAQPDTQPDTQPGGQTSGQTGGQAGGQESGQASGQAATGSTDPSDAADAGGTTTLGSPSRGATVTAATLARDQARIDAARADLVAARVALGGATITAPARGRVVEIDVEEGADVSAGQQVAVLVGSGLTTVEIAATEAQARRLALGQEVDVTPPGAEAPMTGVISRIEHLPATSDSTAGSDSASYPVAVTLDAADRVPALGMPVSASVLIGTAADAVTVPVSAVSDGVVTVLEAGTAARVEVTTGVVGTSTVEVLDGVEAGQQVVLADLAADLPSADDSSWQRRGGLGSGFGGGFGGGAGGGLGGGGAGVGRRG
ncbi:biotin/lipoyl-binding protein [Nocardioides sp. GY 10113]|uniref:HlyD family efflux transporter periplasmic adaptor subunit n=1 Tax=Nocardioides sp. GY 10113 TaxID=2569761 RepID=UPI0010A865B2|nr:biotin/lipoyl-binding protein [Nocardioides sp. GY 10113]TIC84816.1 biotin/lipoyl-binding protein [Nocardioides sp. GY 10113]